MISVKVCGLTRLEDALEAHRLGAWALGFIFYRGSSRAIDAESVGAILRELPSDAFGVGVFVDAAMGEILETVAVAGLKGVQLHGDESPEFALELRRVLPEGVRLFKALRLETEADLGQLAGFYFCDAIFCEAAVPGEYGGTGITGDWELASRAARLAPVILAGGLNPSNVAEAIKKTDPRGVDVCSGVEESAGRKSPAALKEFFEGVRHGT